MKKKVLTYLLSGLIPTLIFFICATINDLLPLGHSLLNIFDSFSQYSGIILEYKNALLSHNIFYSWNAGGGFNLFGTLTYYAFSPLNLLCILATPQNYPYFFAIMTLIRIALLGISMCFYLSSKSTKTINIVLFSTTYALMGYTATYYYNFFWIDAIIMLPLVIYGLDKLTKENKSKFYLISLTITILVNYYIGYMISLFCVIYFVYKLVVIDSNKKKELIKKFIISSLLAGLMSTFVLLPSFFALKTGKASLYSDIDYRGLSKNIIYFAYSLLSGSYHNGDQSYGPALVYSSILVFVLVIFSFFNSKFSKREKIATFIVLCVFLSSFAINALNYAWQFFQQPIWWQSRFSFLFSFFMIIIALKSWENLEYSRFSYKYRVPLAIIFIILAGIGFHFKYKSVLDNSAYSYIFFGFSLMLFLEIFFFIDKKQFFMLVIILTFFDISINTFNSLKQNNRANYISFYQTLREELPETSEFLKSENREFYRMELLKPYTSNDGLYFNYHGINYFNSVRNINFTNLMKKLGIKVTDDCDVKITTFDPVFLSLFNVKYIYGNVPYFKQNNDINTSENPYPLAIGFMANKDIKDIKLDNEYLAKENLNNIINALLGKNIKLYEKITDNEFKYMDTASDGNFYKPENRDIKGQAFYQFTSNGDYLLMPSELSIIILINGETKHFNDTYIEVKKGDKVEVTYNIYGKTAKDKIYFYTLDMNKYEEAMRKLSKNMLQVSKSKNHILEAKIDVLKDGYLFTTINYEEGMSLKVDGKEITPDIILDALIGFDLKKGKHTIIIDYVPKGFKLGCVISLIAGILSIMYLQKEKRTL